MLREKFDLCRSPVYRPLLLSSYFFFVFIPADIARAATAVTYAAHIVPRVRRFAMEEEENLVVNDRVSTPSKKESGYFEENCGDLSDVIFSNYNHYGALLSVDTAGILIINETRRSDHWEESRQGSSFSSGLVEDINDLDVNDSDETKNDVFIKDTKEAKRDIVKGSEVVNGHEGSKELTYIHEDSAAILCIHEDFKTIVNSETPVRIHEDSKAVLYVHEDSKAVAYIHNSSEIIDRTEKDSTSVECATSCSIIVEDWDNAKISDTGKTTLVSDRDFTPSSHGSLKSCFFRHLHFVCPPISIMILMIAGLSS